MNSTEGESQQKERILVTGASGYLAGHICKALLLQGYRVRGSVRSIASKRSAHLQAPSPLGVKGGEIELVELDLTRDKGWTAAAEGCDAVLHVASPLPMDVGYFTDPSIIEEAREGTLRCLEAAAAAGVRRVVLTSSLAATLYPTGDPRDPLDAHAPPIDESCWTPTDQWERLGSYHCSKAAAERAAWDFVEARGEHCFELVTINPSVVIGPLLTPSVRASIALFYRIVAGKLPALPKGPILSPYVDVRDVADAHLEALRRPEAAGRRYLVHHQHVELRALLDTLAPEYRSRGVPWPRWNLPRWLIRALSIVSDDAKMLHLMLQNSAAEVRAIDGSRATRELGIHYRSISTAVRDTLDSLIDLKKRD